MALTEKDLRIENSEIVEQLKSELKDKERIIKEYRKEHGKLQIFFDRVGKGIKPIMPLEPVYKKQTERGAPITAVAQISDSHMGAVQDKSEIEGFGEYSADIADRRNIHYVNSFINWVDVHRMGYNIPECVVLITGDLISGDIHDELRITNEFPVPVQIVRAAQIHASQLSLIAPQFSKVTVHFITEDNHSRLTRKPQAKEAGKNNYNYVIAELMKAYISEHTNIEFNVYPMLEKVVTVSTKNYLITHGHAVRGWMGVPWYGVERKVGKEAQARMQLIMDDLERAKAIGFDKFVFGHFHTPFDSELYSCAGSVSGTDAYDHQAGRYAKPSQPAWLVHPEKGEFNRINFKL